LLLHTTFNDQKLELSDLIQENRVNQAILQDTLKNKEQQVESETLELKFQIKNYELQLRGYALDSQQRDTNIERYLSDSVREGGYSSLEQAEDLNDLQTKAVLKLLLLDNANLSANAKLAGNDVLDLSSRLQDRDLIICNLENKLTSLANQ